MSKTDKLKEFDEPPGKYIIAPDNGWKEKTYYRVLASFNECNPMAYYVFYSGFLSKGQPSGYNGIWCTQMEYEYQINDVYYMHVVDELVLAGDVEYLRKELGRLAKVIERMLG